MENPNPTTAQLTAFGAGKMGWRKHKHAPIWVIDNPNSAKGEVSVIIQETFANFTPTTDIVQALEILDAWNSSHEISKIIDMEYDPWTRKYSLREYEGGGYLVSEINLKDLALQIMLTLWEVDNG